MNNLLLEAAVQKCIATIDEIVAIHLNVIIQHHQFKTLEALWRGLSHLVESSPTMAPVNIRFIDMNWEAVTNDISLNPTLEDTHLYRLIHQSELSTLGGAPFGLIIIEHEILVTDANTHGYDDIYTIQLLSELAQHSLCPIVMPASKHFLGTDDVNVWENTAKVTRILESNDYIRWRDFQSSESSRFFGVTLPQVLLRKPWKTTKNNIHYREYSCNDSGSDYLWGSSALIFADTVIKEFNRIRWFGFLRVAGDYGGAIVKRKEGVPIATSIKFTDALDRFYTENGFITLTTSYLSNELSFNNNRSAHISYTRKNDDKVLLMIQTILMGCRFAHYLKAIIREHIGNYQTAIECQKDLNSWLQLYTSDIGFGDEAVMARYPLKYSKVIVRGNEDLGKYQCEIEIQPQYQFDSLEACLYFKANTNELSSLSK